MENPTHKIKKMLKNECEKPYWMENEEWFRIRKALNPKRCILLCEQNFICY
ncbi:hypothetical protein Hanom_Chr09g00781881 [Helianthus anomalus]